jgi:hypothetical protein
MTALSPGSVAKPSLLVSALTSSRRGNAAGCEPHIPGGCLVVLLERTGHPEENRVNIALWIIAAVLAAVFVASGALKLILPKERLAASGMETVEDFGAGTLRAVAVPELLAAAGLNLPAALGIAPVLTPLAAAGLVPLMVGVTVVHARRHELQAVAAPVILMILAALVAFERFGPHSFG